MLNRAVQDLACKEEDTDKERRQHKGELATLQHAFRSQLEAKDGQIAELEGALPSCRTMIVHM